MSTISQQQKEIDPDEDARQERIKRKPILEECYNLVDFEAVARRVMKKAAWAYYSSGADDEIVSFSNDVALFVAFVYLHISIQDHAREPFGVSEDMVPTPSACGC